MNSTASVRVGRELLEPASAFRPFPLEEYETRRDRTYRHMRELG